MSVFAATLSGEVTILNHFSGADGATPFGAPTLGPDGYVYGTTFFGGSANLGTLYQVATVHPPSTTTSAADGITATQAVLHGFVEPRGLPTTLAFEYDTDVSDGSFAYSIGSGTASGTGANGGAGTIDHLVTGLTPGTTYYFRTRVQNADGVAYGETRIFTTTYRPRLTGVVVFDCEANGSAVSPQNTIGARWDTTPESIPNLWIFTVQGEALNGPLDAQAGINRILGGSNGFVYRSAGNYGSRGYVGVNLFFDDSAMPGISVYGPTGGATIPFAPNANARTPSLENTVIPAAGSASFSRSGCVVTFRAGSLRWADGKPDEVGGNDRIPDGDMDAGGTFALDASGPELTATNLPPLAESRRIHPLYETLTIDVLADAVDFDGDALTITAVSGNDFGTVSTDGQTITYAPGGDGYNGNAFFTYTVSDGHGGTTSATVTLHNAIPSAQPDAATTAYAMAVDVHLLGNDSDPDNDSMVIAGFGGAQHGSPVVRFGQLHYTPWPGHWGTEVLSYRVSDGHGGDAFSTVTITIAPPTDPVTTQLFAKGSAVPGAGSDLRILAGAVFQTFGVPSVPGVFSATWKAGSKSGAGVFWTDADVPLLAAKGEAVPGVSGAVFTSFKDPMFEGDSVVFIAALANAPGQSAVNSTSNQGIWSFSEDSGLQLVARKGNQPPGVAAGAMWSAFTSVAVGAESEVCWVAKMVTGPNGTAGPGGVTTADDLGIWAWDGLETRLLLREGQDLQVNSVAKKVKSWLFLNAVAGSPGQGAVFDDSGRAALRVTFSDNSQAAVSLNLSSGAFEGPAFLSNVSGPQSLPGAVYASFGTPRAFDGAFDSDGRAFLATLKGAGVVTSANNAAVVQTGADGLSNWLVARKGQTAPGAGSATWSAFKDPVPSDDGGVAFIGTLGGGTAAGVTSANNLGVWWTRFDSELEQPTAPVLLARKGMQPPEAPAGAQWSKFISLAYPSGETGPLLLAGMVNYTANPGGPALPGPGGVTSANDIGLWGVDSGGRLRLLVREGDVLGGKTLKSFTVLSVVSGSSAQRRSFSVQEVIYRATFIDGSQAVMKVRVP